MRVSVAAVMAALFFAAPAESADVSVALDLVGGVAPVRQRLIRVAKDDLVTVRIISDVGGELHLHGYKLEATVAPGTAAEMKFKAFATGRYRFEWHPSSAANTTMAHSHGPALATLEVRPQ